MYQKRFKELLAPELTLQQIRGKEGVRMREAYAKVSTETGVPWVGRSYHRDDWNSSDPVNRALSAANSCLYGVCHAAIVSLGYSPGLGFIHTGKQLSFVYDIADLYKTEITIPAAFRATSRTLGNLEREIRITCRDIFRETRILGRIADDIEAILNFSEIGFVVDDLGYDSDQALPGGIWDSDGGEVKGGYNYADNSDGSMEEGD
jgi:CRISPR-associated protein Cas1